MLKMVRIDGLNCPCAFCDACGERIEKNGLMVWKMDAPDTVLVIHKGECDRVLSLLHGNFDMSRELDRALSDLLHNVVVAAPAKRGRITKI